jgi:hypothetical protein
LRAIAAAKPAMLAALRHAEAMGREEDAALCRALLQDVAELQAVILAGVEPAGSD